MSDTTGDGYDVGQRGMLQAIATAEEMGALARTQTSNRNHPQNARHLDKTTNIQPAQTTRRTNRPNSRRKTTMNEPTPVFNEVEAAMTPPIRSAQRAGALSAITLVAMKLGSVYNSKQAVTLQDTLDLLDQTRRNHEQTRLGRLMADWHNSTEWVNARALCQNNPRTILHNLQQTPRGQRLDTDHIIPSDPPNHDIANLQSMCRECNGQTRPGTQARTMAEP